MNPTKLVPSLDDLLLFCKLVDLLDRDGKASLRTLAAEGLGLSIAQLSRRLADLEAMLAHRGQPKRLIERAPGKGIRRITAEGRRFAGAARALLEKHAALVGTEAATGPAELRIGTTNAILVNILTGTLSRYVRDHPELPRLNFLERDYPDILEGIKRGEIDFGVGPDLAPPARPAHADFLPLGVAIDFVLICPPNHAFAQRFADPDQHKRSPAKVALPELAEQTLFVLPWGAQPGLDQHLPELASARGGRRVVVPSFSTIIAFVCMGLGIGLVPGWYWLLDDLRRQGMIFYLPLPEIDRITLAIYLPRSRAALPPAAQNLIAAIQEHVQGLQMTPGWQPAAQDRPATLPRSIRKFNYVYHVSCVAAGYAFPEWRQGIIAWKKADQGPIAGMQADQDVPATFELQGALTPHLLHWCATRTDGLAEVFVTACNTVAADGKVLVGTWVGSADGGWPVSGPTILAVEPLSVEQLQTLTTQTQRIFLNAERRHGKDRQESR